MNTTTLPRDLDGFYYMTDEGGIVPAWRVTDCCQAAVTFHDVTLCCKGCWNEVPEAYLLDPRLTS